MSDTTCPVIHCGNGKAEHHLVCVRHWYKLDEEVRDEIWRLYRRDRGSEEHRTACLEAISTLNEAERA